MERLTEYHGGIAVIKDKSRMKEAMAKLARYEDWEAKSGMLYRIIRYSHVLYGISYGIEYDCFRYGDVFGSTVFMTMEEAENAIEKMKEKDYEILQVYESTHPVEYVELGEV